MNKIYVIGIGPGEYEQMTLRAVNALKMSECIIGYTVYIKLIEEKFPGKEFLVTPMTKEAERCRMAFEEAGKGKTVSVICSGDAGIYGMAGLMYEIGTEYPGTVLEVIPGVTAASSGAALLGAPLMHDFCVISLSDRLTAWEKIESRLRAAVLGDFSICIYNPSSKARADYLKKACIILLESGKDEKTVCGIAVNIGREGEGYEIMPLKELKERPVDMFTTVFIGNSQTMRINGKMVTPRGYKSSQRPADGDQR